MISIYTILFNIWLFSAITMLITWLIQLKTKDASYVDVVWSAGIGCAAIYTFLVYTDYNFRKIIIFALPLFWSIRLTHHLARRLIYLNQEDNRYQTMRTSLDKKANLGFFLFFQVQAIFIVIFATPIIMALLTESNTLGALDILGIFIFIMAILGESISDKQLFNHRKANGPNITCQSGLWYYSRHPNYFFECLHWFAYVCFCFYSSFFWVF